jgi:SAM-dependent methyltransferase
MQEPYYRADLSLVHHVGFGFHAELVAPGVLALLEPVRAQGGFVLELGCGTGLLTRFLVEAGHRVIVTDASPAMLGLAAGYAAGAEEFRLLVMPDDPYPIADSVVGVGHPLNYLPSAEAIDRGLVSACSPSTGAISSGAGCERMLPPTPGSARGGRCSPSSPRRRRTASIDT